MTRALEVTLFVGLIGALGLIGLLVARQTGAPPAQPIALPAMGWAVPADDPRLGEKVFAQCRGCHQPDGAGIAGTYPSLAGNPRVQGDPAPLIRIVLHGYDSRQPDAPVLWPMAMAGLGARLADHEIAGALTFVRSQWGNAASAITADEVARVRAADPMRQQPWTPASLAATSPTP